MSSALTLLVALAAANTNVNLLYLVLGLQASMLLLSFVMSRRALSGIELALELPSRAVATRAFTTLTRISRRQGRPERGPYLLHPPPGLSGLPLCVGSQGPGQAEERAWSLTAPRRGRLQISQLELACSFPFGLVLSKRRLRLEQELLVLPRLYRIDPRPVRPPRPGEELEAPRSGDGHSLRELRPYVAGDSPRRIHWKLSAKREWPLVKEFHETRTARREVTLETRRSAREDEEVFEKAVSRAASLTASHLRRGDMVELRLGERRLPNLRGEAGRDRALVALALVAPEPTAGPSPASSSREADT